ncbi:MAG: TIGR00725 family protein [Candidatus Saganbacteria bacterium]|nr:TIGR00725 family protein [Candidatus Saganbacteria bacterium]
MEERLFITVIGESVASKENYKIAERVGELLAKHKAVIFCGGRIGVMEAICKGAKKHPGATTVGILPSGKRYEANKYIDIPVVTGIGYGRNKLVVKSGQAVIAIGGSYGTLCEMAYALSYKIPTFGINTWHFMRKGHKRIPIKYVKTPEQAVELAVKAAKKVREKEKILGKKFWKKLLKKEHITY